MPFEGFSQTYQLVDYIIGRPTGISATMQELQNNINYNSHTNVMQIQLRYKAIKVVTYTVTAYVLSSMNSLAIKDV